MTSQNTLLPHAETLYVTLREQIRRAYFPSSEQEHTHTSHAKPLAIVGIYRGGAWLAQRLAKDLNIEASGFINAAFHRDDYAHKGLSANKQTTTLPFDVNEREILLVDDVLYTGRTVRAAINEIFDFGRPTRITLAVLVNRIEAGARQLPYCANFSASDLIFPATQTLVLQQQHDGRLALTLEPST